MELGPKNIYFYPLYTAFGGYWEGTGATNFKTLGAIIVS